MNAAEYEWNDRLVFLSRRAYENGTIGLVLRTDAVCDARDTGWQLLYGCETGLELVNPGNSLLVSVARALELEPKLAPYFAPLSLKTYLSPSPSVYF